MKKLVKKVGGEKDVAPGVKESLKKCIPDSKIVMGRAKRGIFAGRHIQFGNRISEDGGNKSVRSSSLFRLLCLCTCVSFLWVYCTLVSIQVLFFFFLLTCARF